MVIRRGAPTTEEPSSDEDDAFSALSVKKQSSSPTKVLPIVPATTSSMKRHHIVMSDTRKAKMDAILQDLELETDHAVQKKPLSLSAPKGSFVQPGEEHMTTNIFVANLCPSISENQMMETFSQFGPLYSLKIMWPRTAEDRARNRLTAFVCFVHRGDADAAMDSLSDQDPFGLGRRLMMRWGKNLKVVDEEYPQINSEYDTTKRPRMGSFGTSTNKGIRVEPSDLFIMDERGEGMTAFSNHSVEQAKKGSNGPYSDNQVDSKRRAFVTGRQLERNDGRHKLNPADEIIFNALVRTKLTASRQSICEATAFCFENSGAAESIATALKDILMEADCSIETRVARLYLLSDVLFNSQQPGIKHAFRYRDAVERMSPDIFASLGQHGDNVNVGRMRFNKLKTAAYGVLSAWTNWSVFDHTFINELESRLEGREIVADTVMEEEQSEQIVKEVADGKAHVILDRPQGEFTEVDDDNDIDCGTELSQVPREVMDESNGTMPTKESLLTSTAYIDCNTMDDIDGEPLDDDDVDEATLRLLDEDFFVFPDKENMDYQDNEDNVSGEPQMENKVTSVAEENTVAPLV